jgi:hypothetical protein
MYDLRIEYPDRPHGAVEVTSATDGDATALWKAIQRTGARWFVEGIVGGWWVDLETDARESKVRAALPALLRRLEADGVTQLPREPWWADDPLNAEVEALGIKRLGQGGTDFPGSVYRMPRQDISKTAGYVSDTGDPLAEWLADWLIEPSRRDNLDKLASSRADERHIFLVLPSYADAPFTATDLLMRSNAPLPVKSPVLPDEVTHVWVASVWGAGQGMRWGPATGWSHFDKLADGARLG